MKTDRFTDIIRRKLESIRPDFTEKDWARMQATLQQANVPQPGASGTGHPFSGGVWSAQPWLMAAAAVSTVVLVTLSVWQRREINTLRQTVSELSKHRTVKPALPAPDATSQSQRNTDVAGTTKTGQLNEPDKQNVTSQNATLPTNLRDTVYITRYVAVPSRGRPETVDDLHAEPRTNSTLAQRGPANSREKIQAETHNVANNLPTNTESYDVSSTPTSVEKSSSTTSDNPAIQSNPNSSGNDRVAGNKGNKGSSGQSVEGGNTRRTTFPTSDYVANQPTRAGNANAGNSGNTIISDNSVAGTTNAAPQSEGNVTPETEVGTGVVAYELAPSHTLSLASANWNALLAQRARKMRSARTTVVNQTPTSQPVQRLATRFRAGVGGEFDSRLWSAGVFTEALFGRHFMLGLGINQATYMNGMFITADEFDLRTNRDFRREFGFGLPPTVDLKGDVINIDSKLVRVQLPISVGYRLPLNQSLTMVSMLGTYMVLSNTERVTYYYRKYSRAGFTEANFKADRPVDLFNSIAFSPGLEWQNKHLVIQAAPVMTVPTCFYTAPGPNWQPTTTIGLRARLLYQF
ncbi:hypothetical protein IC229_17270 [Spirosoma sp. BT702]|uniref:Outer membrane protein beta-barrel domain-containing protein n=1 Tax=Spirosoma profusum TaxID=2771354 RepID=A0A927ARI9_9BACT|nr:hypothetical protein [Spirosoma profusum]MBD2702403.1 hypothetical protein [Spirosoma profusum]